MYIAKQKQITDIEHKLTSGHQCETEGQDRGLRLRDTNCYK